MASQRSQTVVAPWTTWYSHDGDLAAQQHQIRLVDVTGVGEAGRTSGVPRNPVATRPSASRTSRARASPRAGRLGVGARSGTAGATAQPVCEAAAWSRPACPGRGRDDVGRESGIPRSSARSPTSDRRVAPPAGRCGRRRRSRGTSNRPSPPMAARAARRGRASRRTASLPPAGRPARPSREATRSSAACCRTGRKTTVAVAVGLEDGPRHDRGRVAPSRPARTAALRPGPRRGRRWARRARRPDRARGRAASWPRTPPVEQRARRRRRRPGRPRSSRGARRAAGSPSARTRSCRAATRRRSRGSGSGRIGRRLEPAPSGVVAADRYHLGTRGPVGVRVDLGVPEAVEGERRLEDGLAVIGE